MPKRFTTVPGSSAPLQAKIFQGYNPVSHTRDRNGILGSLVYSAVEPLNGGLIALPLAEYEDSYNTKNTSDIARSSAAYAGHEGDALSELRADGLQLINPAAGASEGAIESALSSFGLTYNPQPSPLSAAGGLGNTNLSGLFPDAPQLFSSPGGGRGDSAFEEIINNINEEVRNIVIQHCWHHHDHNPGCGPHHFPGHDHGPHPFPGWPCESGHDHHGSHHHQPGGDGCHDHQHKGGHDHGGDCGDRRGPHFTLPPILTCLTTEVLNLATAIGASAAAGLCLVHGVVEDTTQLLLPCGVSDVVGNITPIAGGLIGHVEGLGLHITEGAALTLAAVAGTALSLGESLDKGAQALHPLSVGLNLDAGVTLPGLAATGPCDPLHLTGPTLDAGAHIGTSGSDLGGGTQGLVPDSTFSGLDLNVGHDNGSSLLSPLTLSLIDNGSTHNLLGTDLGGHGALILDVGGLTGAVSPILGGVVDTIGNVVTDATDAASHLVSGVVGTVGGVGGDLGSTLSQATGGLTSALSHDLSLNVDVSHAGSTIAGVTTSLDTGHDAAAAQVTVAAPSIADLSAGLSSTNGVSLGVSMDSGAHAGATWTSVVASVVDTVSSATHAVTTDLHIAAPVHVHV